MIILHIIKKSINHRLESVSGVDLKKVIKVIFIMLTKFVENLKKVFSF